MKNIKRFISCLLICSVLFTLCSCSFDAGVISGLDEPAFEDEHYQNYEEEYYEDDATEDTTTTTTITTTTTTTTTQPKTPAELQKLIDSQEVKVVSTEYIVQDSEYKILYPDALSAVIYNGSKYDIKNAVVAYVAWDKNNLPVKIIGDSISDEGSYIKLCNFNDINLVPGEKYGNNSGMTIDENCDNIHTFKAIVVSYESFDGDIWSNPYFEEWAAMYVGQRLAK